MTKNKKRPTTNYDQRQTTTNDDQGQTKTNNSQGQTTTNNKQQPRTNNDQRPMQIIIPMDRPLANDHPDGLASCK